MVIEAATDEELLLRIAQRDAEALSAMYDRHSRSAYALAFRIVGDSHETEDVVQEAFLSLWRKAQTFDSARGRARSWLLSVVHHGAIDVTRRRRGQSMAERALI